MDIKKTVFTFSIDWLAFTHKEREKFNWLEPHLTPSSYGRRGYAESAHLPGGGFLAWTEGRQDVHCCLPSKSLSYLSEFFTIDELLTFAYSGKCTRVDLAFDDKRLDGLRFEDMLACIEKKRYVSHWRKIVEYKNIASDDGVLGHTLYFGSGASDAFCRVYDKRAETINKGFDDPGAWVRVELELKGKRADAVMRKMIEPGLDRGRWAAALLNGYLEFKGFEKSMKRADTAPWWRSFLGDCGKVRLSIPKNKRDFETVINWLMLQASPSLALVAQVDQSYIDSLVMSGNARLSKEHEAILKAHKEKLETNQAYRVHWLNVVSELIGAV